MRPPHRLSAALARVRRHRRGHLSKHGSQGGSLSEAAARVGPLHISCTGLSRPGVMEAGGSGVNCESPHLASVPAHEQGDGKLHTLIVLLLPQAPCRLQPGHHGAGTRLVRQIVQYQDLPSQVGEREGVIIDRLRLGCRAVSRRAGARQGRVQLAGLAAASLNRSNLSDSSRRYEPNGTGRLARASALIITPHRSNLKGLHAAVRRDSVCSRVACSHNHTIWDRLKCTPGYAASRGAGEQTHRTLGRWTSSLVSVAPMQPNWGRSA